MGGANGGSGSGGRSGGGAGSGDAGQPGEVVRAANQMRDNELKPALASITSEIDKTYTARENLRGLNRDAKFAGVQNNPYPAKLKQTEELIRSLHAKSIELRKEIRIRGI